MELVLIDDKEWLVSEETIAVLDKGRVPEGMKVSGDIIMRIGPGKYYSWVKIHSINELDNITKEVKGYEDLTRILDEALSKPHPARERNVMRGASLLISNPSWKLRG